MWGKTRARRGHHGAGAARRFTGGSPGVRRAAPVVRPERQLCQPPRGQHRENDVINGPSLSNALEVLADAQTRLACSHSRDAVGEALTTVIQATAEAARFGRIFDLVRDNIRYRTGNAMGDENVTLQNNWQRVSRWIYRVLNNPTIAPLEIGPFGVPHPGGVPALGRVRRTPQRLTPQVTERP
ncbi:ribosome-inactivating family protein [Streptomyces sp. NPDC047821]|uniref:ribosome-inactivating family protein n=1 Tax=Streptomyces sp. NPDC047821 TaxID=3365488 RepID=UPI0037170A24